MEDQTELIRRAHEGDKEARDELIEKNLGLVRHVQKRFAGRGVEEDDLFQIGVIGLMKAIDRFEPSREVMFSTYAVPMIMGEIKRYLREDGPIKISRTIKENCRKLTEVRCRLAEGLGREPRLEELASETGLSREDILLALDAGFGMESLDAEREAGDGNMASLGERIAYVADGEGISAGMHPCGDSEKDKVLDHILFLQMWEGLSREEQRLIWLRYYQDKTQMQVSDVLGISQVQVSRKEKKILEKMRQNLKL